MSSNLYLKKKLQKEFYFLDELFIKYQNEYLKKKLKITDYFYNNNNNLIYIPYTLEKGLKNIKYSFFDNPIRIYSPKMISIDNVKEIIDNFFLKNSKKKAKYSFSIIVSSNELDQQDLKKLNPVLVEEFQTIDLKMNKDEIYKKIKISHRAEIKKLSGLDKIKFKIFDHKNYKKNFIFEMMEMHKNVSGKITRSTESWKINEDMIYSKKAFIIQVIYNQKPISYSFFFHNSEECIYFSSVTLREYFKIAGINQTTIWHAIKFAKNLGLKRLITGVTKYLHCRDKLLVDQKMKNVAFFKSRFEVSKNKSDFR